VEPIDDRGVAQQRYVEPAAAARPPGDGAEFLPALANQLARLIQRLGRKRTAAHARDVRLGYAEHTVDPSRRHTGPGARSARARARRCDERIGAVVDVQ